MLRMVRKPSEDNYISNVDDIIPFRYAYGGQDGYVKGLGEELSSSPIGTSFTIGSGRIVLQGVESDIDANGVTITIDNVAQTRYYVVYYNVNLGNNTTTILSNYSTNGYPEVERGSDLTENPQGSANLLLFRFVATGGIISSVEKVVKPIEYGGEALKGYDSSKGTIEERLTNLGFKEGSIEWLDTAQAYIDTNNSKFTLKRQGNYVIAEIALKFLNSLSTQDLFSSSSSIGIGNVPPEFIPLLNTYRGYVHVEVQMNLSTSSSSNIRIYKNVPVRIMFNGNGTVGIKAVNSLITSVGAMSVYSVSTTLGESCFVGYEAK